MRNLILFYISMVGCLFFSCNRVKSKSIPVFSDTSVVSGRAKSFFERKDYFMAKLCYDTLLSIDSSKGEYYFKRGYSKMMLLNDDRGATLDFINAVNNNYKKKESAFLNLGLLYRIEGNFDSAIYYYDQCLMLDSGNRKAQKGKQEVIRIGLNNF